MSKDVGGRPTVMTEEVLQKLEYYLKLDTSIGYACYQAGISERTFYDHKKSNEVFSQKVKAWQEDTITLARTKERELMQAENPTVITNYLNKKDKTRKDRYEGSEVVTDVSVDEYIEMLKKGEVESFNDL